MYLKGYQDRVDEKLVTNRDVFAEYIKRGKSENYLELYAMAYEQAAIEHTKLDDEAEAKLLRGRSKTHVRVQTFKDNMNFDFKKCSSDKLHAQKRCDPIKDQANRALAWAERVIVEMRGKLDDRQRNTFQVLNQQAAQKITANFRPECKNDKDMSKFLEEDHSQAHLAVRLKLYHSKLQAEWQTAMQKERGLERAAMKEQQLQDSQRGDSIFRKLKAPPSEALKYTTTKQWIAGVVHTTFITDPIQVDAEVRRKWKNEVYDGVSQRQDAIIDNFLKTYKGKLVTAPAEYEIGDITGQQLHALIQDAGDSAGGLDGWTTEDMRLSTELGAQVLADFFNAVERGMKWPKIMLQSLAAFLAKDNNAKEDCMKYRILTIMPLYYRRWAALRLHSLEEWMQSWAVDEMHAGTSSNGAEDAWWRTALDHELARLQGKEVTGGSADIFKCFDQVQRPLLKVLLQMSGCPSRVVEPYMRYLDQMVIYNSVAGTLGEPHQRKCSIPQGCPLSMTMMAFLLRPWVGLMKHMGCTPRVLADDIMLWDSSMQQESFVRDAYEETLKYITNIGGQSAPAKSYLFSTNRISRKRLRDHRWQHAGLAQIPVLLHGRDLGGQFCTAKTMCGATLTHRIRGSIDTIQKIRKTGYDYHTKAKAVRAAAIPKGLYGCEAAPACEQAVTTLRSAIAKTIAPQSSLASLSQVFSISSYGSDLDPEIVIIT